MRADRREGTGRPRPDRGPVARLGGAPAPASRRAGRTRASAIALLVLLAAIAVALLLSLPSRGDRAGALSPAAPQVEPAASPAGPDERAQPGRSVRFEEPPLEEEVQSSLEGRVVVPSGAGAGEGVRVLFVPGPRPPRRELVAALLARADDVPAAWTDPDGRFLITGLAEGRPGFLFAGGGGFVAQAPRGPVSPGGEPVLLTVRPLYACLLELVEPDGSPLRVNDAIFGARLGRPSSAQAGAEWLAGNPPSALVAGVDTDVLASSALDRRLIAFVADELRPELTDVRFRARYPGYEPIDLSLSVPRFAPGELAVVRRTVAPTAAGFGACDLELAGWTGDCPAFGATVFPASILELHARDGREKLHFSVDLARSGPTPVEGLPYGDYLAFLRSGDQSFSASATASAEGVPVSIGAERTRLRFDLSDRGAIELHVRWREADTAGGFLTVMMAPVEQASGWTRVVNFKQAPYLLSNLAPGRYRIGIDAPFRLGVPGTTAPLLVEVRGGECHLAELHEP